MPESIKLSTTIPASPHDVFVAWLDSKKHSAMTGEKAAIDPSVGGTFTAWEDYISGTTTELETNQKIVQSWRTTDFPVGSPDSTLEILLEEAPTGTKATLIHSEIPDGQGEQYKDGWKEFYFDPMKAYFKKHSAKKQAKKASKKAPKKQERHPKSA